MMESYATESTERRRMPSINNIGVKKLRREQAETRQAAYDKLSDEAKLAQIEERRGKSKRETARIVRRLHPSAG